MNKRLEGGCQVPIACFAEYLVGNTPGQESTLRLRGLVGRPDGTEILRAEAIAADEEAEALGVQVAEALLAQGATAILKEVYGGG
jgi:hydroxymethylbilane synthase